MAPSVTWQPQELIISQDADTSEQRDSGTDDLRTRGVRGSERRRRRKLSMMRGETVADMVAPKEKPMRKARPRDFKPRGTEPTSTSGCARPVSLSDVSLSP